MEISPKPHDPQNPSPLLSPTSPPLTSRNIPRSDSHPYPTTFVQADTSSFKHVVQMLTGSPDSPKPPLSDSLPPPPPPPSSKSFTIPPVKTPPKKQGFKLYERRNNLKNSLMINTFTTNFPPNSGLSPRKPEILSPSLLDFPSLSLSPVTPLNDDDRTDPFEKSSSSPLLTMTTTNSLSSSGEEERAIAEKGFYLHPSPLNTPRDSEPRLLPLFPVTSPRVSESESPP
ncbi:VQ motif-containing protein 4-like [Neltuma alba]|uniref:VQ motif-containing protein 4-like n=1 Tax=Neltuma alba TaxID=207710 RepID=UPI0010A39F88|nr:VQ motif-containing protein 4-like [Prosopis alba]XP_028807474.1 VQ motif-containing protein 4-like [Prosopis alba]